VHGELRQRRGGAVPRVREEGEGEEGEEGEAKEAAAAAEEEEEEEEEEEYEALDMPEAEAELDVFEFAAPPNTLLSVSARAPRPRRRD
jgi:hypothetical protein